MERKIKDKRELRQVIDGLEALNVDYVIKREHVLQLNQGRSEQQVTWTVCVDSTESPAQESTVPLTADRGEVYRARSQEPIQWQIALAFVEQAAERLGTDQDWAALLIHLTSNNVSISGV